MRTTLGEIVARLSEGDGGVILIRRPLCGRATDAVVVRAGEPRPAGFEYLLEVDIASEVIEVWTSWRAGRSPTVDEACEAVIHYAENDAYLPAGDGDVLALPANEALAVEVGDDRQEQGGATNDGEARDDRERDAGNHGRSDGDDRERLPPAVDGLQVLTLALCAMHLASGRVVP